MKPKEKYRMGAVSVTDTHVAFIVTTDTSYLCVADVDACRFLEVSHVVILFLSFFLS